MNLVKAFIFERRKRLFQKLWDAKDPMLIDIVNRVAEKKAMNSIMHWLDKERLSHCRYCPATRPLRNHPIHGVLCEGHYKAVMSQPTPQKEAVNA